MGFAHKEEIDYEMTFAFTTKWTTIGALLALVAQYGWEVHKMDLKTVFSNDDMK